MSLIHKIALGTVQFGLNYGINNRTGQPSEEDCFEILATAKACGIFLLDTAEGYNNAQEIIGTFHRKRKEPFEVVTKLNDASLADGTTISERINSDRGLLHIERIYGYLFHSHDAYKKHFNQPVFTRLKEEDKIHKVGVSVYTNAQATDVANDPEIDIVQLPFNLLDNWKQRGPVLSLLKEKGKEVHVRSVFLQGLLLMKQSTIPAKLKDLSKHIAYLHEVANDTDLSIQQLALGYALQNQAVDKVLIGVDTVSQLTEHIDFINNYFPNPLLAETVNEICVNEVELLNPSTW